MCCLWFSVVRIGEVRCGMVSFVVVRCGVVRYGIKWWGRGCGKVVMWYGIVWLMGRCCVTWYGVV